MDYGLRRVGVCVGVGFASRPLEVIEHDEDIDAVVARLLQIARRERIASIVVGLPLEKDGAEGLQCAATRRFADALAAAAPAMPLVLWDERFSSREAEGAAGAPARRRARRGRRLRDPRRFFRLGGRRRRGAARAARAGAARAARRRPRRAAAAVPRVTGTVSQSRRHHHDDITRSTRVPGGARSEVEVDASRRRRRSEVEVLAQEGAAVVERAPIPRRRVRALDVGDDARAARASEIKFYRVLGACVEIKNFTEGRRLDGAGRARRVQCQKPRVLFSKTRGSRFRMSRASLQREFTVTKPSARSPSSKDEREPNFRHRESVFCSFGFLLVFIYYFTACRWRHEKVLKK